MKKIKLFFLFAFFLSILGSAQIHSDSVVSEPEEYVESYEEYEEEVIVTPSREERGPLFYEERKLDDSFKEKYTDDKFNYDKVVKEKEMKEVEPPSFHLPTGIFSFLMYAILVLIIGLILYYVLKNAGGFHFGNPPHKIKIQTSDEKKLEDVEHIENNNFAELIANAKKEQDYRKAIRYYYLWVLQKLTDRNIIKFHKNKTDYDYFIELDKNPIKEDFSQNTYIYDYIWYGKFPINEREFDIAEAIFQRTLHKIR
jgi:hypothetical protein